jgi:hypothetical protein
LAARCFQPDADILRVILFAVDASGVAESQQKLEELIREGYDANFWGNPSSLRV